MIDEHVTVIIPTSPIPAHPSTDVIERTVVSIRKHMPFAKILILCDGVRPEMEFRREQYGEYLMRLSTLASEWRAQQFYFSEHRQQAGMLKSVLPYIRTPLLFFCEHDAVLDEEFIDWVAIARMLLDSEASTVRLYWNAEPHPEHLHLMGERRGDFVKTIQWSSWPYVSRVDFHHWLMAEYFKEDDCKMTETVLYSPCLTLPWEIFRTWIYCPPGHGVTFRHMDARRDPVTDVKDPGSW
jgi:hypothetical protein